MSMIRMLDYIGSQLREKGDPLQLLFLISEEEFEEVKNKIFKNKKDIEFYTLNILLDLDKEEVNFTRYEVSFDHVLKYLCISPSIFPRQTNKRPIPCIFGDKKKFFLNSLFNSEFINAIEVLNIDKDNVLYNILRKINGLSNKDHIKEKIEQEIKKEDFLITLSIKTNELDKNKFFTLSEIPGFKEVFSLENLWKLYVKIDDRPVKNKLSYVDGQFNPITYIPKFIGRNNINTIFVRQTTNFAFFFKDRNFNYFVSRENLINLNIGSKYILDNWRVNISGVPHIFIPKVLDISLRNKIDILGNIKPIQKDIELLFNTDKIIKGIDELEFDESEENPVWLTFYGYDTGGGNYFKIINIISDISANRLRLIRNLIIEINKELSELTGEEQNINFYTFYKYIPVKLSKGKNSEQVPVSLKIFKDILEGHKIDKQLIYQLAAKTFNIQYFKNQYYNIKVFKDSNFDYLVRDTILIYFALIKLIKKLNLMEVNNNISGQADEKLKSEELFFEKMEYNQEQKAMFYLGRLLSIIANIQSDKMHKAKPILNKLNYNGMDKREIIRLAEDLFEKIRQYSKDLLNKKYAENKNLFDLAEFYYSKFNEYFTPNNWRLSPEEALFFILSGYSYFSLPHKKSDNKQENDIEKQ